MNHYKFKYPCLLTAVLLSYFNAALATDSGLNFSVRLLGGSMSGQNTTSDTDFQSSKGGQFGMSMAYQYGGFYTGLNIQGGDFTFEKQAPDQVSPTGTKQVKNDKVKHNELDLVFGYYLMERISLFIDLKGTSDTWESNQHKQEFNGAGIGAAGYWPINDNWLFYGSIGAISSGEVKYNGEKIGTGSSRNLDIGLLYKVSGNHRLIIGARGSRYAYVYDSGDKQVHNIGGTYVGYNYLFPL